MSRDAPHPFRSESSPRLLISSPSSPLRRPSPRSQTDGTGDHSAWDGAGPDQMGPRLARLVMTGSPQLVRLASHAGCRFSRHMAAGVHHMAANVHHITAGRALKGDTAALKRSKPSRNGLSLPSPISLLAGGFACGTW